MSKHKFLEILIATAIGTGVTIISKIVEAQITNQLTSISNVVGGIAASGAYLIEQLKRV